MNRTKIAIVRSVLQKKLYGVNFSITYLCNHRCKTCNIWRIYLQDPTTVTNELNTDEVIRIIEKLSKNIMYIQLTGGEPTLRKDLAEIVKTICSKNSLISIGMPTNGFMPRLIEKQVNEVITSEEWRKSKTEWTVSVSLDGLNNAHDRMRGRKGAFGCAMETYYRLSQIAKRERRFDISIGVTVSTLNLPEVLPFLSYLKQEGFNYGVTFALDSDYYRLQEGKVSLVRDHEIDFLKRDFIKFTTSTSYGSLTYLLNLPNYLANRSKQVMPCSALLSQCTIDPYGSVEPCIPWEYPIGNLRDFNYDLGELLMTTCTQETRKNIAEGKCPNCWTPCEAAYTITRNTFCNPINFAKGLCSYLAAFLSFKMQSGLLNGQHNLSSRLR